MNTKSRLSILGALLLALLLFTAMVVSFQPARADVPGPLAAVTPVSVNPQSGIGQRVQFFTTDVITQDTYSPFQNVQQGSKMDLQWVVDQTVVAAAANTTTLTIEYSCDGNNWVTEHTPVNANTADANAIGQFTTFCAYGRVYANVTNTNPLTITVMGLVK